MTIDPHREMVVNPLMGYSVLGKIVHRAPTQTGELILVSADGLLVFVFADPTGRFDRAHDLGAVRKIAWGIREWHTHRGPSPEHDATRKFHMASDGAKAVIAFADTFPLVEAMEAWLAEHHAASA
jgi:hypothetical protein